MRQLIIARKDLGMSPGKLAAQVAHASMSFLSLAIRENAAEHALCHKVSVWGRPETRGSRKQALARVPLTFKQPDLNRWAAETRDAGEKYFYYTQDEDGKLAKCDYRYNYIIPLEIDRETMEGWFRDSFVKTVCEAKNRSHLMKAVEMAEGLDLHENKDYFLIKDNCLTELTPEETDENGVGRTLTCIGFRPLPDDIAHAISRKYQLYK